MNVKKKTKKILELACFFTGSENNNNDQEINNDHIIISTYDLKLLTIETDLVDLIDGNVVEYEANILLSSSKLFLVRVCKEFAIIGG